MKVNEVSKCLEKKLLMFGFEIPDLLATFILLSTLNLVFGNHPYKMFFVWIPPLILAITLRVSKRGKPENYLIHWLRFQLKPGNFSAFYAPKESALFPVQRRNV